MGGIDEEGYYNFIWFLCESEMLDKDNNGQCSNGCKCIIFYGKTSPLIKWFDILCNLIFV